MRGWSKNRLGLWSLGILVGIAILLVFTAKWLRTDQPLTDTAKKFIQPDLIYRANVQQHSYFYLLGIAAKDEVHPQALGRYRYHREWANYIRDQNAAENLQSDSGLNRQLSRAGFSEQEKELLENLQMRLANSAEQFSVLVVEHKKLLHALLERERIPLQRFSDLLEHQDYISLVIPPQAGGPDYRYIQNLQLLKLVHIQLDSDSKVQDYAQQFHQVLDFSRNRLSLVEKMLLQNWLSQMIDLIRIEQKNESNPVMLNNLDSDQLGLKASLQNELMGHYLLTQYLAHASEISPVQLKWLYLPNTTFNAIAAQYEVYWMLSEIPYVELQERFTTSEPSSLSKWRLKNAIGHVLAQISKPNFEKYIVMNHVLNNKIMTFNAVNSGSIEIELLNQNAAGRRYFQQDGKLCVALPFSQQKLSELNLKQDSCVKI